MCRANVFGADVWVVGRSRPKWGASGEASGGCSRTGRPSDDGVGPGVRLLLLRSEAEWKTTLDPSGRLTLARLISLSLTVAPRASVEPVPGVVSFRSAIYR